MHRRALDGSTMWNQGERKLAHCEVNGRGGEPRLSLACSVAHRNSMARDIHSDFSPEEGFTRFQQALGSALSVSKADLNRLLEKDKVTPLVPQKRGRKPKSL